MKEIKRKSSHGGKCFELNIPTQQFKDMFSCDIDMSSDLNPFLIWFSPLTNHKDGTTTFQIESEQD